MANRRHLRPRADSGGRAYVRHLFCGVGAHIWPVWTGANPPNPSLPERLCDGSLHRQDRLAGAGRGLFREGRLLRQGRRGASRGERLGGPGRGRARPLRPGRSRALPVGARRRDSGRPPARAHGTRRDRQAPARPRRDAERAEVGLADGDGGRRREDRGSARQGGDGDAGLDREERRRDPDARQGDRSDGPGRESEDGCRLLQA